MTELKATPTIPHPHNTTVICHEDGRIELLTFVTETSVQLPGTAPLRLAWFDGYVAGLTEAVELIEKVLPDYADALRKRADGLRRMADHITSREIVNGK